MEKENDYNNSRRKFLRYLFKGSLAGISFLITYPIIKYIIPPKISVPVQKTVIAAKVGELNPNSGKIFKFGNKPGILIKTPDGQLKAFSAVCTHLGCIVQYRKDFQHIWCACHNGHYNLKGINIKGPPPRPLTPYDVNVKNGNVYVSKKS
jgi:Rieske Fe-S protein